MTVTDPCQGARARLQPYLDRTLTPDEVSMIEAHLRECSYCRDRYHFEAKLRDTVRTVCCGDPVPEGLVDRLRLHCRDCGVVDVAGRGEIAAVDQLGVGSLRPGVSPVAGRSPQQRSRDQRPGASARRRSRRRPRGAGLLDRLRRSAPTARGSSHGPSPSTTSAASDPSGSAASPAAQRCRLAVRPSGRRTAGARRAGRRSLERSSPARAPSTTTRSSRPARRDRRQHQLEHRPSVRSGAAA